MFINFAFTIFYLFITGEKVYLDENNLKLIENGPQQYWETKINLFGKKFCLSDYKNGNNNNDIDIIYDIDENNENLKINKNNNNNNNNNNIDDKVSDENNYTIDKFNNKLFKNKKSARYELAIIILKEVDMSAYEEMVAGQENVRKKLQTYRDGVLSGKEIIFYLFYLFILFFAFYFFFNFYCLSFIRHFIFYILYFFYFLSIFCVLLLFFFFYFLPFLYSMFLSFFFLNFFEFHRSFPSYFFVVLFI